MMENDRLICDMNINPFNKDDVLEASKYAPFIASNEQTFSIIGKSETKIYVNDREKKLASNAIADYFKRIPHRSNKKHCSKYIPPTASSEVKETLVLSIANKKRK